MIEDNILDINNKILENAIREMLLSFCECSPEELYEILQEYGETE